MRRASQTGLRLSTFCGGKQEELHSVQDAPWTCQLNIVSLGRFSAFRDRSEEPVVVVVVVYLTLTDPLRTQSWSQYRLDQTKSNREYVRRKAGKTDRRERTRKKPAKDIVAINKKQKTQTKAHTEETNKMEPHKTLLSRLRKRGSRISGGIQPRHEDRRKDNVCNTQRKKNTEGGKGNNNQMKLKNEVYRHKKHHDGLTAQK